MNKVCLSLFFLFSTLFSIAQTWPIEEVDIENTPGSVSLGCMSNGILVANQYGPSAKRGIVIFQKRGDSWNRSQLINFIQTEKWTIDISDDYIMVGARTEERDSNEENPFEKAGAVYVLKKEIGKYRITQKLTNTNRASNDYFGQSLCIQDSFLFVSYRSPADTNTGGVAVYKLNGSLWQLHQQLLPGNSQSYDLFGSALAVENDILLVGSKVLNGPHPFGGSVYIYKLVNGYWLETQQFEKPNSYDGETYNFGHRLAVHNHQVFCGAYTENHINGADTIRNVGAAYIYDLVNDSAIFSQRITASNSREGDKFGASLDVDGNLLVIGAFNHPLNDQDTDSIEDAGAIYIFKKDSQWIEHKKISQSERDRNNGFGHSVFIDGYDIVVDAPWTEINHLREYYGRIYAVTRTATASYKPETLNALKVYPNPSSGQIQLELDAGQHSIKIYNVFGKLCFTEEVSNTPSSIISLDLSHLIKGLYRVVVEKGSMISTSSILLQ